MLKETAFGKSLGESRIEQPHFRTLFFLRRIHGDVGCPDQLVVGATMLRKERHTDGCINVYGFKIDFDGVTKSCTQNSPESSGRLVILNIRHDDHEFITAPARKVDTGRQASGKAPGRNLKDVVANTVSHEVIDFFEFL